MDEEQMKLLTMMHIPNDIMMNILSRLPSKSLKRFKCAGKYLFNLIEDPTFVKMHLLHHSTLAINNPSLLISNPQGTLCSLINYREDVAADSSLLPKTVDMAGHSNLPFKHPPHQGFDIVGNCNGLICLCDGGFDYDCVFFLWNPSTDESKRLPHDSSYKYPVGVSDDDKLIHYGFCYDHTIDDYKVIKTVHYFANEDVSIVEVNVYTLRSNSWNKKIKTSPLVNCVWNMQFWSGLFVHGALHSIMMRSSPPCVAEIISFDVVKEEYLEIQIPKSMVDGGKFFDASFYGGWTTLKVLNGCCCIFYTGCDYKFLEVWMMKEYNVKESWTKLFRIDMRRLNLGPRRHWRKGPVMFSDLKPLRYGNKDGEVLVVWGGKYLVLYDPKKNEARCVCRIKDHVKKGFVEETYIESLVSLKDQTNLSH